MISKSSGGPLCWKPVRWGLRTIPELSINCEILGQLLIKKYWYDVFGNGAYGCDDTVGGIRLSVHWYSPL